MEMEENMNWDFIGDTFLVNTDTTCLICLKHVLFSDYTNCSVKLEQSEDWQPENVSLRSICRYLKINERKIFTAQSQETGIPSREVSNFSVTLCRPCSSVASKLSDLCAELELIQMRVTDCVRTFNGILSISDKDRCLVGNFQNLLSGGLVEPIHGSVAEVLRTEIKAKCSERILRAPPRVQVTRLQQFSRPVNSMPSYPRVDIQIPTPSPPIIQNHVRRRPGPASRSGHQISAIASNLIDPSHPPIRMPGHRTPHTQKKRHLGLTSTQWTTKTEMCTYCTPPRQYKLKEMKRHKIHQHLDILFTPLKLPHLSPSNFREYCDYVIQVEMISARKLKNSEGNPVCQCPNCTNVYNNPASLRYHLFADHEEIVARKLVELQRSSTLEEIRAIPLPNSCFSDSDRWKCVECGQSFAHGSNLWKHKRKCSGPKVPGKKRRWTRRERPTSQFECDICGAVLKHKWTLLRHRRDNHGIVEVGEGMGDEVSQDSFPVVDGQSSTITFHHGQGEEDETQLVTKVEAIGGDGYHDEGGDEDEEEMEEPLEDLPRQQIYVGPASFVNCDALGLPASSNGDGMVIVPHDDHLNF